MKFRTFPATTLLVLSSTTSWGGSTDLQFVPTSSAGHDFNHAPIGQSFKALTSNVKAGIFITDEDSFTTRLSQTYPGLPPFPYAVAPKWRTRGDTVHRFPTGPREVPGS